MNMNSQQLELWQRLENHELDDPAASFPFSVRLAGENAWSLAFTRRAVAEYRRFVFLAVAAGHPVSPPDAVDQVWHLHLLYTHDYWGRFCPQTLGMPLHHGPTRGGSGESAKFSDWYARTLASYRRFFGEPPVEFWPAHPAHPRTVRVEVGRFWILPRPKFPAAWARAFRQLRNILSGQSAGLRPQAGVVRVVGLLVALAVFVPVEVRAAEAESWPLNLRGPDFLMFYFCLAAGVFLFTMLLRRFATGSAPSSFRVEELDPYEIAHLAGGASRVMEAALASLAGRGLIKLEQGKIWRVASAQATKLPLLESVILAATQPNGVKPSVVHAAASAALQANQASLEANGLVMGSRWADPVWLLGRMLEALVVFVGAMKIFVGLDLGKPVGYLVMMTLAVLVAVVVRLVRRPSLTRRGEKLLADLKVRHAETAKLDQAVPAEMAGSSMLPLAVGLFGLGALSGTALAGTQQELEIMEQSKRKTDGGSGCGTTSSGGSESSGGGDGGGGDGGGGGCGGCGGD